MREVCTWGRSGGCDAYDLVQDTVRGGVLGTLTHVTIRIRNYDQESKSTFNSSMTVFGKL